VKDVKRKAENVKEKKEKRVTQRKCVEEKEEKTEKRGSDKLQDE